jgi:hypothetical protein
MISLTGTGQALFGMLGIKTDVYGWKYLYYFDIRKSNSYLKS